MLHPDRSTVHNLGVYIRNGGSTGTIVCGIAAIHCVAGAVRIPQLRRPFWDVIHDGGFNAVGLSSVCFQPNFCPASPSVCGPRCVHAGSDCFGLVPTKRAMVGDDGRSDEHVSNLGRSISTRASAFTLAVIADTRRTLKSRCRLGSAGDCSASMRWARSSCREAGFRFFWLHVVSSLHVLAEVVRRAGPFVDCSHIVVTETPPSSVDITNVRTQPGQAPDATYGQAASCVGV